MKRPLLAAAALLAASCSPARTAPPVIAPLPAFTLADQSGRTFGSADLKGHPWVANFIYTRCSAICPRFTEQMADLKRHAAEQHLDVRFVSFSVDPNDTPATLAAYAKTHAADWTFLGGSEEQIQEAVVKGLKVAAQPVPSGADAPALFHGSHFVLVDGEGRIRGYYDSEVPARVEAILADAAALSAAK